MGVKAQCRVHEQRRASAGGSYRLYSRCKQQGGGAEFVQQLQAARWRRRVLDKVSEGYGIYLVGANEHVTWPCWADAVQKNAGVSW